MIEFLTIIVGVRTRGDLKSILLTSRGWKNEGSERRTAFSKVIMTVNGKAKPRPSQTQIRPLTPLPALLLPLSCQRLERSLSSPGLLFPPVPSMAPGTPCVLEKCSLNGLKYMWVCFSGT